MRPSNPTRVVITALAAIALLAGAASGQGKRQVPSLTPESRDYDQKHIRLDLEIDFEGKSVSGECRIALEPLRDGFDTILLDSEDTTVFDVRVRAAGEEEASPARSFRIVEGLLRVDLGRAFPKGEEITIEIDYRATPSRGLYFFSPTEKQPDIPLQVWSQGEGRNNHHWFPCYDQPDDRITSEIHVRVPAGMEVISNGKVVAVEPGEDGKEATHHIRMDERHVPYLVSLIVGEFDHQVVEWEGIPLHTYVPVGMGDTVDVTFGGTADMMAFFSDYTGERYPYSRYSQTTVWEFMHGGMENTTATTLNLRALHDEQAHIDYSADGLIAHELAHQWFGDLVTCLDWNEMWLNEGFATYFTDLYFEEVEGHDKLLTRRRGSADSWVRQSTPKSRAKIRADRKKEEETRGASMAKVPLELPKGHNYGKGASVLHILRRVMGDEKFRDGIRRYVAERKDSCVTSEDLRAILEAVHGGSLQVIFDEWVYGAGHPELEVEWEWIEEEKTALLRVKQVQDETSGLFHVPVTVAFHHETDSGLHAVRKTIEIGREEEEFRFPLEGKPVIVRFDEGDWIPKRIVFPKGVEELEYQVLHDPDVTGRLDAVDALAEKKEKAIPALAEALAGDPEVAIREAAARRLGGIQTEEVREVLVSALDDDSPLVRSAAAGGLGAYPAGEVEEVLIARLRGDPSRAVQASAARSLGRCKSKPAKEALLEALHRGSHRQGVEVAAAGALADLGDPSALPALIEAVIGMTDSLGRSSFRGGAIRALARLGAGDARAKQVLIEMLGHPSRWTRISAARALGGMEEIDLVPPLLEAAEAEKEELVRRTLVGSIRRIVEATTGPAEESKEVTEPAAGAEGRDREAARKALEAKLAELEARRGRLEEEIGKIRDRLAGGARREE